MAWIKVWLLFPTLHNTPTLVDERVLIVVHHLLYDFQLFNLAFEK